MTYVSHSKAFAAQADLPVEAKIKVGKDIWTPGTHGARLYAEVLSKNPGTVQKAITMAAELKDAPFTPKAVQGHLRWIYTAGELAIDGTSYVVQAKPAKPKAPKVEAPKVEPKPEAKPAPKFTGKPKAKVAASSKRSLVRTKKPARAA
jgi:hypothetical protein